MLTSRAFLLCLPFLVVACGGAPGGADESASASTSSASTRSDPASELRAARLSLEGFDTTKIEPSSRVAALRILVAIERNAHRVHDVATKIAPASGASGNEEPWLFLENPLWSQELEVLDLPQLALLAEAFRHSGAPDAFPFFGDTDPTHSYGWDPVEQNDALWRNASAVALVRAESVNLGRVARLLLLKIAVEFDPCNGTVLLPECLEAVAKG
jgi:hypothetical protein